eukprot:m.243706 g.243706  ORF g.243706 m.243706 type:complete len:88 (-) comp19460_c0_seq1:383-646(-)
MRATSSDNPVSPEATYNSVLTALWRGERSEISVQRNLWAEGGQKHPVSCSIHKHTIVATHVHLTKSGDMNIFGHPEQSVLLLLAASP